ncbi:MAG: D-alanyl-D-alanine carboxypeptidase/D-alanyl-D-alanine-endopeptidase [Planctomycetes bacterium]|nr:D-alanyl-D-alanine carboxypeptidase/D-alanyl-D-alanine-endopeptidase [Planctomycetota bacterium]
MRYPTAMARWGSCVVLVLAVGLPGQACERVVAAAEALGARTGVAVCDAEGRLLFGHRVGEAFAPASNMKLLAAAAVLDGLGPDHTFETVFRLRAGRLVVEASGDPNWIRDTEHAPERVFGAVAAALRQRGVITLAGIDLEPGCFTGPARPPGWPRDQLQTYYCAPTGPFVLEQGTFVLQIAAPAGAAAAQVELVAPVADRALRGSIELVDRPKDATYGAVDRDDAVQVRGRFPRRGAPVTIRAAVQEPSAWYLAALRRSLAAAGIAVAGERPAAVADAVVHRHRSALRPALARMLEDSSNFAAEQCLRVLGARTAGDGSLAGGLAVMRDRLTARLGELPAGTLLLDGSGLSRDSRVTPGLLAAAMLVTANTPAGEVFVDCLPVAGRTGTLADRFAGTDLVGRVRAKTGWIRGVSALSGVVHGRDGTPRWFVILMNYDARQDGRNKDLKRLQEELVAAADALPVAR